MAEDPKIHPIDFAGLKYGDIITVQEMEEIFSIREGSKAFEFARLGLASDIRKKTDLIAVQRKGDIAILTPSEAVGYLERQETRIRKALFFWGQKASEVPIQYLDGAEVRRLDHFKQRNERLILAEAKIRKSLLNGPHPKRELREGLGER